NGWYQILLEDVILPVNIIFNNGSGGESNQTANLQVTNDTNVYFFDGTWYASKEDAHTANGGGVIDPLPEEPVLPTTVYFYNSNNWTDVYAWAWNAGGNAFETWPGIKAQVIEGKDSWFMVEVPFEGEFGILFSNGLSNADERKTDDLIVTEENVYASLAGIYSSFDAAEEAVFELEPEVEVDVEIWFLNSKQKWETLKVFTFSPEIVG